MPSVLIEIPIFDGRIWVDVAKSLFDLERPEGTELEFKVGYDCAHARTLMAEEARSRNADYLLMVDSDIILPSDALSLMLSDDVDVCFGYYPRHGLLDGTLPLFEWGSSGFNTAIFADEIDQLRNEGANLLRVKGGGLGCALIRTSVFDRISYPWFDWITYSDGHGYLSEDLYFCQECQKANVEMYVDTRVSCGHIWREEHRV